MKVHIQRFTCGKKSCNHGFDEEIIIECSVEKWSAFLKTIRCPKCGGKKLFLGGEKTVPDFIPQEKTIQERMFHWAANGATGTSSKTIFEVLSGQHVVIGHGYDRPYDPADFNRCYKLLELIPEWRPRLVEVSARFIEWKPLVDRWPEMESLLIEEFPSGSAPKLYELIKQLRKEGDALAKVTSSK